MNRIALVVFVLVALAVESHAELRPDLDYFPSRLHAAIFRNWDIVPPERLASVLQTDVATVRRAGAAMGLTPPPPLTPEEIRRNVEIVLRRNWPLLSRSQIEALLGMTAGEVDEFLSKESFLPALLAGQPDGLTPLKYEPPDAATQARIAWFGRQVKKHLRAVAATPEEPRLAFIKELCQAHAPGDFIAGTKPKTGDADLRSGWRLQTPTQPGIVLQNAVADFADYCRNIQRVKKLTVTAEARSSRNVLRLEIGNLPGPEEAYNLSIKADAIEIRSVTELGLSRGLIELERRMAERGGPFLAPASETNAPAFATRYISSYFSLLTDVLGQDLVDPFPDGYLNELKHQDAEGVWIYTLLSDLVPSPVFDGLGAGLRRAEVSDGAVPTTGAVGRSEVESRSTSATQAGSEARLKRLRTIVDRAAKHGLKVYLYLNEPRAQFLPFFGKYPDVKGQPEGHTAALCTSTEAVQRHLRGSCERLFRAVPGLGGVFVITASENLSNCYSHTRKTACERCAKRSPADVIAESIRCLAEGVWAADPKAKFIVWDWSWHSVLGEDAPEEIIARLPKGVALMADFERGMRIERGGIPMTVDEYSISIVGPSPRARLRGEQARRFGGDYFAKIQLSTTWECGTVPFIPVPALLARKATAMREAGVTGVMATWTLGSYPSPNTEAFAVQLWNPQLSEDAVLRRVAARRYGADAVESTVRGWTKLSNAFSEEFPYTADMYAGPLQHGPSLPLYRRDLPPPFGRASLLNSKDDYRNWAPPYGPEKMATLLRHLCDRWDDGMKDLKEAARKTAGPRRRLAERDLGVAWMVGYTYRAYANALDFYKARDAGDAEGMKRIAAEELKVTEEAFRLVRADSRLGWELELQYFYRPLDVLERLLSLAAVVDPMPGN